MRVWFGIGMQLQERWGATSASQNFQNWSTPALWLETICFLMCNSQSFLVFGRVSRPINSPLCHIVTCCRELSILKVVEKPATPWFPTIHQGKDVGSDLFNAYITEASHVPAWLGMVDYCTIMLWLRRHMGTLIILSPNNKAHFSYIQMLPKLRSPLSSPFVFAMLLLLVVALAWNHWFLR